MDPHPRLYLLPISTLFIPVVYAALNFGVEGAIPTALLCVALSLPNVFLFHDGPQRIGVLTPLALLLILGVIVAARVDREQHAKEVAESANRSLQEAQDSLRSYVLLAMRAQETERQRLSRELHDETIQDLVVVRNSLRGALQSGESLDKRARLVESGIDRSIDDIRRLCRALRPSILDDLGLISAIEALTGEIRTHSKLNLSMDVEGTPVRLPAEAELAIYRVVQEALHNVERHSLATRASVELNYDQTRHTSQHRRRRARIRPHAGRTNGPTRPCRNARTGPPCRWRTGGIPIRRAHPSRPPATTPSTAGGIENLPWRGARRRNHDPLPLRSTSQHFALSYVAVGLARRPVQASDQVSPGRSRGSVAGASARR